MVGNGTKRWAAAYWGCAAVHGLSHVLDLKGIRVLSKAALMPLLAGWCRSHGCPRLLVAALIASSAGDSLMEQDMLLPGMAMYAAAHCCYSTLFIRDRTKASWPTAVGYTGLGAGVVALLWPGLGRLRTPVALYSATLSATAVTSSWYGPRTASGGALFLVSDALIGTGLAGHTFPARGALVGLTYTAGQYQLAAGVVNRVRAATAGTGVLSDTGGAHELRPAQP